MNITKIISLSLLALTLVACSGQTTKKSRVDKNSTASAAQLLKTARASVREADFEKAISQYETLEARFPLGRFAQQSLLEQAYAYYKFDEPDTALDTIDRYMRIYPRSPKTDYALYLRGLINFTRGGSIVDKVFPRNFSDLDNVRQKEAFHDFSQILTRHPRSPYAADAKKRVHFLKNSLGSNELGVAKYYMKRGAYLAAFNRAEYTIQHHQGTPAVIEALQLKICAAKKLGKQDLANDTMRVLKVNFPKQTRFSCSYK